MIEIVRAHIREGIRPVPIPYRQKKPVIDNWPSLVITEENLAQYFNGAQMNVGAILGAPSGNLQDVDLDCLEALHLARAMLPPTRTFGRASNPTSHYLYRSPDLAGEGIQGFDDPIAKALGKKSKLLELRSNGGQTVLPGSTHKDTGETIEWDNPQAPIVEQSRAFLETCTAELAAGCMMMRYWRPSAADVFVSTFRAAGWNDEKIYAFLTPIAGYVNMGAPSIDPAAWRDALAIPRAPERAEEKEKKKWEKASSDFVSKMMAWFGFPVAAPEPRKPSRSAAPGRGDRNLFARARAYVAAMPEAISGSNGSGATLAVARKLAQDFQLSEDECWTILCEYNERCKPPWSEKELRHKLHDATHNARVSNPIEDRPPPEPARRTRVVNEPEPEPEASAETTPPEQGAPPPPPQDKNERNWRRHLITKKVKDPITGQPKDVVQSTQPNVSIILTFHPDWAGLIVYDKFLESVIKTREPPWPDFETRIREPDEANYRKKIAYEWTELDTNKLINWLARNESITVTSGIVDAAVTVVASAMERHPVRDYLRATKWDGEPRLDTMLHVYFKTDNTEYTRGVSSRWMISAVARAMSPGCQADCALILESKEQGLGKSTGIEILASAPLFADSGIDIGNKDSYQNLRGVWIYEIGELDAFRGRDVTKVKNFISARSDRYRPSFGKRNGDFPRQNVFIGTTNENEYFQDTTGNRRFFPVPVREEVDRAALHRDRDQIWAEAHERYLKGEAWHVDTKEFRALCEAEQHKRVREDVWAPMIIAWLKKDPPKYQDQGTGNDIVVNVDEGVLTHEVIQGALRKEPGSITRGDEMRVATILRGLGYEPKQGNEDGKHIRRYVKGK